MRRISSRPTALRHWLAVLFALFLATGAEAADAVFVRDGTVGLVPPPGMAESSAVAGFEDRAARASILIAEMPPQAFKEISGSFASDGLAQKGVTIEKRQEVELADGVKAVLLSGYQTIGAGAVKKWILIAGGPHATALITVQFPEDASARYPDATIETALRSVVLRAPPSIDELAAKLPFRLEMPDGYRIVKVLGGGAAVVTKGSAETIDAGEQPFFTVAVAPGDIREDDRASFSRRALASVPGVKDVRPERGGPLRISGQPGFEIIANAEDAQSGKPVKVAQWISFGRAGYVRMIGVAPAASFEGDFAALRSLRDGVALK